MCVETAKMFLETYLEMNKVDYSLVRYDISRLNLTLHIGKSAHVNVLLNKQTAERLAAQLKAMASGLVDHNTK